ncbi:MAG: hypothetical protein MK185_17655 [Saccharospirillaceae bacterium]|nr:hypothetical protein [Saccharospirillaceae bacterium]
MSSATDMIVNGIAKGTGWTRDFTGDVLGTAGAGVLAFAGTMVIAERGELLADPKLWFCVTIAGITSAMVWKRNRRDNG